MDMVGRGDDHGVELPPHLVDHHAEILVFRDVGVELERFGRLLLVHVAQGGDAAARLLAYRRPSLPRRQSPSPARRKPIKATCNCSLAA